MRDPANMVQPPLSLIRQRLMGVGEDVTRLATELYHPLPFKQENLDLIRGNFVAVALVVRNLADIVTEQELRIEALERRSKGYAE